jgi:hypothetical protein
VELKELASLEMSSAILYLDLHQELLQQAGEAAASEAWQRLVASCDRVMLLEPGAAPARKRGGRGTRKRRLKEYQRSVNNLLLAVGPRLRAVEEVAAVSWEGLKRTVYQLEFHPVGSEFDLAGREEEVYGSYFASQDRWEVVEQFRRGGGRLVALPEVSAEQAEGLYRGTDFYLLRDARSGRRALGKKILHNPVQQMREFTILRQVDHPRVIKLLDVHDRYGLVFPYVPWTPLPDVDFQTIRNAGRFRAEVIEFFAFLRRAEIHTGILDHRPGEGRACRLLAELVDMHGYNFLLRIADDSVADWVAVDMQYNWKDRTARNRSNKRKILRHIDGRGMLSLAWRRLRRRAGLI